MGINARSVADKAGTGIRGLDEILRGDLPGGHILLVEGVPVAGKTTLALQFSLNGYISAMPDESPFSSSFMNWLRTSITKECSHYLC